MKKNDFKKDFQKYIVLAVLCLSFVVATAQTTYVNGAATVYMNGSVLTNQVIVPVATATVNMTANTTFTGTGYVEGVINVLENGTTIVPVGDTAKSAVTMTTVATDNIATDYTKSAATGTMDASLSTYKLSDAEFWSVTSTAGTSTDVAVTGLTNTASTYGGETALGSPVVVRRDNTSSNWVLYSSNPGFGEFAYASETQTLGVDEFNVNNFAFYPNPVNANASSINFNLPSSVQQLDVIMYNVTGKVVQHYTNVPVQTGANSINKPQVANGLYLLQFSFNNGAQTVTKRLIIE